jgi:predicted transcriptional regulator
MKKNWDRISSEKTILTEAKAEAIIKVIKKAKEKGISISDISDMTGLSKEEIENL